MWNILFYVNYPSCFQQWNWDWNIIFPNSSIDAKLRFLNVGPRLYFQIISNSQRGFGIFKCCSSWTSQFFPVYHKDRKLGFLKTSLDCIFKFFPIHERIWKLEFLKSHYILLPSLKPSSYSKKMSWGQGWQISKAFRRKKYDSIHSILLTFAQFLMSLH